MQAIKELKSAARQSLSGKWGSGVLLCLAYVVLLIVIFVVLSLIMSPFTSDSDSLQEPFAVIILIIFLIASLPLYWAFMVEFLNVARGNPCKAGNLFHGYNDFCRICGTMLLQSIYTFLWTLLLIIPGIIKYYSYALTPYILNDDSALSFNGAIDKSMAMMRGHKMDLFILDLSFIGWYILGCVTCDIGFLWIIPYWQTTRAHFYLDLKEQQELQ